VVFKNLVSHKERNSLTAIIYSLTLSCLIFLIVMLNMQASIIENISGFGSILPAGDLIIEGYYSVFWMKPMNDLFAA
jgi:hypothetical protein